jgi:8-oxo-dGTP pyrophosphatase MutT (NUDIX family)
MPDEPTPVPAATVVPLRDEPGGGLAVLMVRRAATMAYGGMWAFPGGRIDSRDRAAGEALDGYEAARRAAVREAAEEIGLAFPPEALVPFTHWTGGAAYGRGRRFATWYFLAPAPEGTIVVDGSETEDHRWTSPADALAARDRGEIDMVAPTWMTLTALAAAGSVAEALALAGDDNDGSERHKAPARYVSRMVVRGDRRVVLWQGDAGYPTADPDVPGPRHRLVMDGADWRLEVS